MDAYAWQASWDAQQSVFLPDREERFAALLDVVEALAGTAPRVLDLAGGTGSITQRLRRRLPAATAVVVDVDAALLAIARSTFESDANVSVVTADLGDPTWLDAVPDAPFDAILTATALHWLSDDRRAALYAQARGLLRDGGVFVNADHMPDPGLPGLDAALGVLEQARQEQAWAQGRALSTQWWEAARADPELGPFVRERDAFYGGHHAAESNPDVSWHPRALEAADYREVGLVWRGRRDAAVEGVR